MSVGLASALKERGKVPRIKIFADYK